MIGWTQIKMISGVKKKFKKEKKNCRNLCMERNLDICGSMPKCKLYVRI